MIGNSNDETSFPHKLLSINTQVPRLCKRFANVSSANIELSKPHLRIIGQSRRFLGRPLGPLLKTGVPLMKNVFKPLATCVLLPLGSTAAATTTTTAPTTTTTKKNGSRLTKLIISNTEMNDIMKTVRFFEDAGLL